MSELVRTLVLCLLLLLPDSARAENALGAAGARIGGWFTAIARALAPRQADDRNLDRALATYASGDYFATYVYASRLRGGATDPLRDEANLLMGLAAADAGLRGEAIPPLRSVLEADRVSPYYPVALGALVELEARLGNDRSAADAAERYFAALWRKPRSAREAQINALFLEQGNLSSVQQPLDLHFALRAEDLHQKDRPADRAVYHAGMALLRQKKFAPAIACFEALEPQSPYFPFARYGYGQALYGLGNFADARTVFVQVYSYPAHDPGESFLRHRAALLIGQLLYELDEDDAAIEWLRRVAEGGPFALHAVLLSAEIYRSREKPALAVVYLKDRPDAVAEPKLVAQAAAMDASLHRDLGDLQTAAKRLQEAVGALRAYARKIDSLGGKGRAIDTVRGLLVRQEEREQQMREWRRRNLTNAIPDLVYYDADPGWMSRMIGKWLETGARTGSGTFPIIYYPDRFDPFSALPAPSTPEFEPPSEDGVFPALFRRSLSDTLEEALRRELDLRRATEGADPIHLPLLLLDTELRLRDSHQQADAEVLDRLGVGGDLRVRTNDGRPRAEVVARALRALRNGEPEVVRRDFRDLAGRELERWRRFERDLLLQAAQQEKRVVEELLYGLEFDLSQTFSEKKRRSRATAKPGS
ncbi:MAG: Anaphase-promoting complex, cyclosome, subunit 3 [Candidatus Binatota bacterium]|nr:Anaphase-promoting complex, cyclosome, subunit 3 [Candidatus Binatota bacterium]